ncbi:MAG: GNAT family N-acetyltransferase [Candidatus Acidiferrales bacterium]
MKPATSAAPRVLPPGFLLRRVTSADGEALAGFYRGFEPKGASLGLPPHKKPERWLATLAPFPNFLVFSKGKIVAHAVLCPEGDAGEVAVFVGQEHRGRGLGRCLMSELVEEARRLGLRRVWGLTEFDNIPMRRLARSLGFVAGKDPYEFTLDLERAAFRQPRAA